LRIFHRNQTQSDSLLASFVPSKNDLYSATEIKTMLNSYISSHKLVNSGDQAYINLDDLLYSCVAVKQKSKGKNKDVGGAEETETLEFMKRDELTRKIVKKMQSWYEVTVDGKEPVRK